MIRCGRDYTSKMRSVDVFKCWPFAAAGVTRHQAESSLPPMTVPSSRRWRSNLRPRQKPESPPSQAVSDSDEFVNGGLSEEEEEKVDLACPVCRDFNAPTLTAVNAHIDGCLARSLSEERRRMRRFKSKAPKKRSIAEIFDLKEDDAEARPSPEIATALKLSPFDAGEVSIEVTKLRWLEERLEALRSNGIFFESAKSVGGNSNSAAEEGKSEMLCPVCGVFNAATVTAANAHIDGCLAEAMKNERWQRPSPKPKAPKKRSIADILTITPQIDTAGDDKPAAEAEKDDEGETDIGKLEKYGFSGAAVKSKKSTNKNVKKKVKRKIKTVEKRCVVSLNDESKKINKRKKKKKKKELTAKKAGYNLQLDKVWVVGSVIEEGSEFRDRSLALLVSLRKTYESEQKEDAYKRKMQSPVYLFRKAGTTGNKKLKLDDDIDASSAHEKKLGLKMLSKDKKEKVKILNSVGKQQKTMSPIRGILKNHKHISGSTSSVSNVQDGTEESHFDVQVPSSEKHVRCSAEDYVHGPKNRRSLDETVFDLSSDVLDSSPGKEQSCENVEGTANLEQNRNDNIAISSDKRKEVCSIVESKQFSNTLGQVAAQNLLKHTNQDKSKHLVDKSESLSNVTICDDDLHRFDRGKTTTMHFSPHADVSRSLSTFQGGQTSGRNTQACESEAFGCTGKFIDHLGDPNFQSRTVLSNASTRTYLEPSPSSASCIEECLSIGKRHVVQKTLQDQVIPFPQYPGGLSIRYLHGHGRERADIYQHNSNWCSNHSVQPLDSELNLKRNPFIEQNEFQRVPNHKEYGMVSPRGSSGLVSHSSIQPTMRLMGKDVPIGRISKEKQQFVGGGLWADAESRKSHYSVDATKDNSLLGRCSMPDWVSGSSLQMQTENVLQSLDIQSNRSLESTLLMKGPNSEFLNLQSNHVSQNGSPRVSRNASSNLHPVIQAPPSGAMYNRAPQGFCFHSQIPSSPCNLNQSTLSNGELNDWRKHHRVPNSSLGFPFFHPIVEEQARSSWFKRSCRTLPPWSLGSTYERVPGSSSSTCFPPNILRENSTIPFVNHSADVLYPPNCVTSDFPTKALFYPVSVSQPSQATVSPFTKPPSAIDGCRNKLKLDDMTAKDYHPCTNSRKRPADNLVDPAKPTKLPHKNLTRMTELARETSIANLEQNTRAVELDLQVGARSKGCQNEAQNLNPRSYLGFDSYHLDGMVKSGPVKLSPGAKHILKPSENLDNSTPIHSAIPIAAATDCVRDIELQGKLTKMYIF
ncbi:hypothetical protein Fmac_026945 [Flemingia macrophylla]|uniref:UBZ4-type domain-containing protein n=1 Tax=Flemingia macrophylla TaxID=520843 RepID=A0ABD1LGI3_9FABA